MSVYTPDRWAIIKIKKPDEVLYKLLGGWCGGYLGNDSWRLNSGIKRHEFDGNYWYFHGNSGSVYRCYVDSYGFTVLSSDVFENLKEKATIHYPEVEIEIVKDQAWVGKGWSWLD